MSDKFQKITGWLTLAGLAVLYLFLMEHVYNSYEDSSEGAKAVALSSLGLATTVSFILWFGLLMNDDGR